MASQTGTGMVVNLVPTMVIGFLFLIHVTFGFTMGRRAMLQRLIDSRP